MISYGVPGYKGRILSPEYVIVHHTAGTNSLNICINGRSDLPGPLCQYLISKNGTVHHITDGYANHTGVSKPGFSNYNCIGIELENLGNGSDPYPEVQMEAARQLCRDLGLPVYGHKEICVPVGRKIDPSFDMDAFRESLITAPPEEDVALTDAQNAALANIEQLAAALNFTVQSALTIDGRQPYLNGQLLPAPAQVAPIDLDAIAEAVADKLAARLAN